MGHTDVETMANVTIAKYDFDDEAFQEISENAKDFIQKLLLKDIEWVDLTIIFFFWKTWKNQLKAKRQIYTTNQIIIGNSRKTLITKKKPRQMVIEHKIDKTPL